MQFNDKWPVLYLIKFVITVIIYERTNLLREAAIVYKISHLSSVAIHRIPEACKSLAFIKINLFDRERWVPR